MLLVVILSNQTLITVILPRNMFYMVSRAFKVITNYRVITKRSADLTSVFLDYLGKSFCDTNQQNIINILPRNRHVRFI